MRAAFVLGPLATIGLAGGLAVAPLFAPARGLSAIAPVLAAAAWIAGVGALAFCRRVWRTRPPRFGLAASLGAGAAAFALVAAAYADTVARVGGVEPAAFAAPALSTFAYLVLMAGWEEVWFRGLWFEGGSSSLLRAVSGAAVFALAHLWRGPEALISAFAIGVVLGSLRMLGAALLPLIALHAAVNLAASLAPDLSVLGARVALLPALGVGGALLLLLAAALLRRGPPANLGNQGLNA